MVLFAVVGSPIVAPVARLMLPCQVLSAGRVTGVYIGWNDGVTLGSVDDALFGWFVRKGNLKDSTCWRAMAGSLIDRGSSGRQCLYSQGSTIIHGHCFGFA